MSPAQRIPKSEYKRRLSDRRSAVEKLERDDGRYANGRLLCVAAAIGFGFWAAKSAAIPWWIVLVPIAGFVVLAVRHDATLRRLHVARDAAAFYERGLARMEDRWAGQGVSGLDLVPENHVYAADIDLFGEGSVFELLCTARTKAGEESLAKWLCGPASLAEIVGRQLAVEELRNDIDLREDLAVAAGDVRARVRPKVLIDWAGLAPRLGRRGLVPFVRVLSAATLVTGLGWAFWGFTYSPFLLCLLAELILMRVLKRDLNAIVEGVSEPSKELQVLAGILGRLESASFQAPKLVKLQQALSHQGRRASEAIARLDRLLQWLDAERNMMFAPIAFVLLWRVHFSLALEAWRASHGSKVASWLASLGELEALSAFAGFAYERPDYPFAEVAEAGLIFAGKELGHPLIPAAQRVRNDVEFGQSPQVLIVSGSNMAGKSTLLRTIGVNTVLALAGAPVCAKALRLSRCNLGATIRIEDSIRGGASRFYAEITRLKQLLDLTKKDIPLLFMLDELFGGTNSHDREVGAHALIESFIGRGALGLVTTHDLSIATLEKELGDRVGNVHFEDQLKGAELIFDYTLRPGVVRKSNALQLMRAVGLEV